MHLHPQRLTFLGELPKGEPGTTQTLHLMRKLANQFKRDPYIREVTLSLIAGLQPKDWIGEIRTVFEYVRDRIRYARDIHGAETLQTPPVTLDLEAGDCDDKSTLLAAMLGSIGHPTRFVAVGYERPGAYSHVYVETRHGSRWIAMDATVKQPLGWAPRPPLTRLVIHN